MAFSFAPSLLVLATLIALVLPQLILWAATMIHSTPRYEYDVFISFRGEDALTGCIPRLLAALERKRIRVYKEDTNLSRWQAIGPQLFKAIETSKIAVVLVSKNYVTSKWCLDELVKIMECKRMLNERVLPIFYDVNASEVLEQKMNLAEALFNGPEEKVGSWRAAMMEVTNFACFRLVPYRQESQNIERIAEAIWNRLHYGPGERRGVE